MDNDKIKIASVARVLPGDIVVLESEQRLTKTQRADALKEIKNIFPENKAILLCKGEFSLKIHRPVEGEKAL